MKKNKNNLARNTVKIRKRQRAQEEKTKKKRALSKAVIARISAVLACVLLVGALAVPCFAGTIEADREEAKYYRDRLLEMYDIQDDKPLYHLLNPYCDALYLTESPTIYQVRLNWEQEYLNSNMLFLTYNYTEPFGDWENVVVGNWIDGSMYPLGAGYWSTSYTTTGDNRFLYLKYNSYRYDDGSVTETLRIRFKINKNTFQILEVTAELKDIYNVNIPGDDVIIASVGSKQYNAPIDYGILNGLLLVDVALDYEGFKEFVDLSDTAGYDNGYSNGYTDGYDEAYNVGCVDGYVDGYQVGFSEGREEGENIGYNKGKTEGLNEGRDDGLNEGIALGYNAGYEKGHIDGVASGKGQGYTLGYVVGYDDGYDVGVTEQQSALLGKNLLGDTFSAPINALNDFGLVTLPSGQVITLGGLLACVIGLALFLALIKILGR